MEDLQISAVQNGFVVREGNMQGYMGKTWAFESAGTLAGFMLEWGEAREKENEAREKADK